MAKRRKTVLCDALGCSGDTLEVYQSTRTTGLVVYTDGRHYFTIARDGERLPTGWDWCLWSDGGAQRIAAKSGYVIWHAS